MLIPTDVSENQILNCNDVRKDGVRRVVALLFYAGMCVHESKPKQQPERMWKLRDFPGPGATNPSGTYTVLSLRKLHNYAQIE